MLNMKELVSEYDEIPENICGGNLHNILDDFNVGYSLAFETQWLNRFVYTTQGGRYSILVADLYLEKTTALSELKEME